MAKAFRYSRDSLDIGAVLAAAAKQIDNQTQDRDTCIPRCGRAIVKLYFRGANGVVWTHLVVADTLIVISEKNLSYSNSNRHRKIRSGHHYAQRFVSLQRNAAKPMKCTATV